MVINLKRGNAKIAVDSEAQFRGKYKFKILLSMGWQVSADNSAEAFQFLSDLGHRPHISATTQQILEKKEKRVKSLGVDHSLTKNFKNIKLATEYLSSLSLDQMKDALLGEKRKGVLNFYNSEVDRANSAQELDSSSGDMGTPETDVRAAEGISAPHNEQIPGADA